MREVCCLGCGKAFSTNYWNKKYCGSEQCEQIRSQIKQQKAETRRKAKPDYKEKLREKYSRNRERDLAKAKKRYWQKKGINLDLAIPKYNALGIDQKQRSSQRLDFEEVKNYYIANNYEVLSSEYSNVADYLLVRCPEGHTVRSRFMSFKKGHRCIECAKNITQSKAEKELILYFKTLFPDLVVIESAKIFENERKELDIYFPVQKVAVEYCGLRWHSESLLCQRLRKDENPRSYHRKKAELCWQRGIRLITVFEDEYESRPEVVKSRIVHALGLTQHRLFARKAKISTLSWQEASVFFETNHLQSKSPSRASWGLSFGTELDAVISVGALSRAHAAQGERVLELKRFATRPHLQIAGGVSRLFKQVVDYAHSRCYTHIVSYADMRYADPFGSVYEKLGFTLVRETKYTPHYVKCHKRYRNQSLRKTPEERLTGKTEWELRREQGFDRIWDCGHRTYVYNLNK